MSYETQIIEMLLKNDGDPNIIIDNESPLHKAVSHENIKLVEMLLDNGADPNINSNMEGETWRQTPLNIACETVNIPIIKLLLERGAIPNDNDDETNLGWIFENEDASSEQKIIAIQLLLEHDYKLYKSDYFYLFQLKDDDIEIAKLLLQYVDDPNIKNKILLETAKNDQTEIVKLLLDSGADPNTFDEYNKETPLTYAIMEKNLPMMILLLERGADPHYVWEDFRSYRPFNMLELAKDVRFRSGLEYLETYISEKNKMQNTEQRLAISMALNPHLGQYSTFNSISESGLYDKITSYVPEYNTRYAPDVGRRMMLQDK